jgi:predicted acetyltransferase
MIELRTPSSLELTEFLRLSEQPFHDRVDEAHLAHEVAMFDPSRCVWAWDADRPVGTAAALALELTLPGGRTGAAAGITVVGVLPTHRRRGIMASMMQRLYADARERDEPIAVLWAVEAAAYRSSGFGCATRVLKVDADASVAIAGVTAGTVQAELVDVTACHRRVGAIYERLRVVTPGMFRRGDTWLDVFQLDHAAEPRDGAGPMFCVVVSIDGRDEACALYRVEQRWPDDLPDGVVVVCEALAASTAGIRELWRHLLSIDLTTRVRWSRPGLSVNDPLEWMVDEPARLRLRVGDGLWLRLVDVGAGLAARGYADKRPLVFELSDAACPTNAGRWKLADGVAERSSEPAELALSANELGAVYLGDVRPSTLVGAGRIDELIPGAAARADSIFASTVTPWCPQPF